jgi:hypothetical protein
MFATIYRALFSNPVRKKRGRKGGKQRRGGGSALHGRPAISLFYTFATMWQRQKIFLLPFPAGLHKYPFQGRFSCGI